MRRLGDLIIDGLLLAVPLIALVFILGKTVAAIGRVLAPLAAIAPGDRWFGVLAIDVLAVGALLVGLVLVGAFARSAAGRRVAAWVENVVLRKIPGFLLFKAMASGFSSTMHETGFDPVRVEFDDHAEVGFVVEDDGRSEQVVVFLPSAPTAAAGMVVIVDRTRVHPLGVPAQELVGTVTRLGMGLQGILQATSADRRSQK